MKEFIDKLIDELEGVKSIVNRPADIVWNNAVKMCIYKANELAEEYKVSEMPTCWIPCSERLPKAGTAIRVWLSFTNPVASFTKRAWWSDDHFEWDNGQRLKESPLAWMPSVAPAPYTEGK